MIRIGFWGILYYNQNKAPTFEHWPLYYTLGNSVPGLLLVTSVKDREQPYSFVLGDPSIIRPAYFRKAVFFSVWGPGRVESPQKCRWQKEPICYVTLDVVLTACLFPRILWSP